MSKAVFKSSRTKVSDQFLVELGDGEYIFREGDLGTEMYIIQTGEVEILKRQSDGKNRPLAILAQGDFFGEMSILEDLPRTASAKARGACKLVQIDGATFDQMLRKTPEIAVRMMRKLSRRLRETDVKLRDVLGSEESQVPEMPTPEAAPTGEKGPEKMVHTDSGLDLFLAAGDETSVGRLDPVTGIHPDIDLTPIDEQRSISRRHATVFRRDGKFYVREEVGTMNGTFVNGQRIKTGVPVEFSDGDEVRFGVVKLIFHAS